MREGLAGLAHAALRIEVGLTVPMVRRVCPAAGSVLNRRTG